MIRVVKILLLIIFFNNAFGQQNNTNFVEGEIYIKIKPQFLKTASLLSRNTNLNLELPTIINLLDAKSKSSAVAIKPFLISKNKDLKSIYRLKLDASILTEEFLKKIKSDPFVEYVERVRIRKFEAIPNDTRYSEQWSLEKIKAHQAWDENPGLSPVTVAIIDNAFQINHPDLASNVVSSRDVADNDDDPSPPNSTFNHGTHVAGIVSAVTNNSLGIAAAANNKVKIMAIKATPNSGSPNSIYYGFEGIQWAVANGAKIISLSWGGTGYSQLEQDVINDAYANGAMIIAAAGNSNSEVENYPASYDHVISVASLDANDSRSSFSSYGPKVDISAPGRAILSTIPFDTYGSFSGTSMATPLVASCVGYLKSCFPSMSIDSLEMLIKNTSDDIYSQNPSFVGKLGTGRINLLKAVSCRTQNLSNPSISTNIPPYICMGDSVQLFTNLLPLTNYSLIRNNQIINSGSNSFIVKDIGQYKIEIERGNCKISTPSKNVNINTIVSEAPVSNTLETYYCSPSQFLVANSPVIINPSQYVFNYVGPEIGYDNGNKSGNDPRIHVSGVPGLIDSVFISISWQKKDGGNELNCGLADGGARPYNEEVSFDILSPDGTKLQLIASDTYLPGSVSSGLVTTVFKAGLPKVNVGSLPTSGRFDGLNSLSLLKNEVPNGVWTLLPNDNSALDPLCISAFSITIKNNVSNGNPNISWWNASQNGSLLVNNDSLLLNTQNLGKQYFYAQNQYEGRCPSSRIKSNVNVKSVPEIVAFKKSDIIISPSQGLEILAGTELSVSVGVNNVYSISGKYGNGSSFTQIISNTAPLVSPISFCDSSDYFLLAMGCNGTISWSNGENTQAIFVKNIKSTTTYTATCNQTWTCPPLANIPFQIKDSREPLSLISDVVSNTTQKLNGNILNSSQKIESISNINYSSPSQVVLLPGFEVNGPSIFKAEIKACEN